MKCTDWLLRHEGDMLAEFCDIKFRDGVIVKLRFMNQSAGSLYLCTPTYIDSAVQRVVKPLDKLDPLGN
jgi:hypothetical protein